MGTLWVSFWGTFELSAHAPRRPTAHNERYTTSVQENNLNDYRIATFPGLYIRCPCLVSEQTETHTAKVELHPFFLIY